MISLKFQEMGLIIFSAVLQLPYKYIKFYTATICKYIYITYYIST